MVREDQRMSQSDVFNAPDRYGASGWGCLGAVWVACEYWSVARRSASQTT